MPKLCAICGKQKSVGHTRKLLRGHENITGNRTFKPNLQRTVNQGRHILACVKCIKNLNRVPDKAK